jgi:integrase
MEEPSGGRSQEVRFATWREIDLTKCLWYVPPEHMKTRKEHRVALANEAIELLHIIPRHAGNELIFRAACMKRINKHDQKNWCERVL